MKSSFARSLVAATTASLIATSMLVPLDASASPSTVAPSPGTVQLERLDRGLVAAAVDDGVFLSWRLLAEEVTGAGESGLIGSDFVVYRDGVEIAFVTDSTNYMDPEGGPESKYRVVPVVDGVEVGAGDEASAWSGSSLDIPLVKPADGVTPTGQPYTYRANDMSVGDVDGDGGLEYIVKWDPTNQKDNSQVGYTGSVYIDTYELDGTLLNRIDLGVNIRAGAHYTQFLVYDFDGDERAEIMMKTAPGTKSIRYVDNQPAEETLISMPAEDLAAGYSHSDDYRLSAAGYIEHLISVFQGWNAHPEVVAGNWPATLEEAFGIEPRYDYPLSEDDARSLVDHFVDVYAPSRSSNNKLRQFEGFILSGPEYLTIFDGETGVELDTVRYEPGRTDDGLLWGDYAGSRIEPGNRVDRFLGGVAYLDGEHPSAILARGYYSRSTIAAYDWDGDTLTKRWLADSGWTSSTNPFANGGSVGRDPELGALVGQGFHSLSAADVDGDGRQEIVYGSATLDDDGSMLYSSSDIAPPQSTVAGQLQPFGHGDAMHVTDIDPARPGLEIFTVHENTRAPYGMVLRSADDGEALFGTWTGKDTGRGMVGDVLPDTPGIEVWGVGLHSASGEKLSDAIPGTNQSIRWAADMTTQVVRNSGDVAPIIHDFAKSVPNWEDGTVLTAEGTLTNNSTKGNPSLVADVLGDWREELLVRTTDSSAIRVYLSTEVTDRKMYTLLHDPQYRAEVARQQTAYNQPSYPGFYLASDTVWADVPVPTRSVPPHPVAQPGIGVDSRGINVTWKTSPVRAHNPVDAYRVTLTDDAGALLTMDVAPPATSASFAAVPPGNWTAVVEAINSSGASAPSAASASAHVRQGQPVSIRPSARSQCSAGAAHVAVHAENQSNLAAEVRITVLTSEKKQTVAPRAGIYVLSASGERELPAGSATITAYQQVSGVGYHATYSVPYEAVDCR